MTTVKRVGLRWLLPAGVAPVSAGLFWYGMVEDRAARAALEKSGWHFGAAWHPNSLVQTVGSVNLPAMLGGVLFVNLFPETVLYLIVFGVFVPVLWWCVGAAADVEFGFGRALGRQRPPLRERAITISCTLSACLLVVFRIMPNVYSPRLLGVFWIIVLPLSILGSAAKWRRKWLPSIKRGQ